MKKLEKGQIVIVNTLSNAKRRYGSVQFEAVVTTVGRKYFTVDSDGFNVKLYKFSLETFGEVSNYRPDYEVFINMEEYNKQKNHPILLDKINRSLIGTDYDSLLKVEEFINKLP